MDPESNVSTTNTPQSPGATTYPFVSPFGAQANPIAVYPNDVVQLDVYNAVEQYLETDLRIASYIQNGNTITLDLERDVSNLGYISGQYKVTYRFYRNYLGSGDAHKMQIQEVSADGLEVRVIPATSTVFANSDFFNFFGIEFFNIPKSQVLPNLFLFKDPNTSARVFDYVQDKFTYTTDPYSIIFKFTSPIPSSINVGDFVWLSQQINEPISDVITIIPPKIKGKKTNIAGPNWDIFIKDNTSVTTQYKDWDDLLSTNTQTSQDIINKLLSSSFVEGIPLNIDYKQFENFITFGSAVERLQNFKYKMELLEHYNARIASLTTDLTGLPSSSVSNSIYLQSNVLDAKTKKAALIGSFDGYEKYLYNQSSSYVTNSFGGFYPTTWPKSGSIPYTNYSYTSSQVEEWFDGIISSASIYDQNNDKALYKIIPPHVVEDTSNEEYVLLTQMLGHYFDIVYAYAKQINNTHNREESLLEGFSKDLVYYVSKNLGIDFENGSSLEELWGYMLGTDSTGSLVSNYGITAEDKTKEIWKRIVNNLPYLLKTKGTERGVKALISCFGIPQTILRIREFGGAEPGFDTKTDLVYERFNYAYKVGYATSSLYYYNTSSWNSNNSASGIFSVPWKALENNLFPMATQLRVQMAPNRTEEQILMEVQDKWHIKTFKSNNNSYIGFFLNNGSGVWATASVSSSIYDGTFHSITLQRSTATDSIANDQTYSLIVKKTAYEKVVATQTASLFIAGASSSSYNNSYASSAILWIPGFRSSSINIAHFTGSIQEFRYWKTKLDNDVLDNHALAPTSYQGNTDGVSTGSTSSFYDLSFRLCLGSDNKKINYGATTSFVSQHPNQTSSSFYDASSKIATFLPSSQSFYSNITEIHSLEWPDLGGNRSVSNKIRIDTTEKFSNNLQRNTSVERPLTDDNPPDSARLGIYLSPTNEVNQDIAEQFGGLSIDDFIGDPSYNTLDYYPGLESLKREYTKKYNARVKQQNYIRLLKHYDAALFKLLKQFVPYRANTQVGLVIESDLLHRSKVSSGNGPSYEALHYSSSIVLPDTYVTPGGFVQDGDGEPFRDSSGYVSEGVINSNSSSFAQISSEQLPVQQVTAIQTGIDLSTQPTASYTYFEGSSSAASINPSAKLDEYNGISAASQNTTNNTTYSTINLGISSYGRDTRVLGSKYVFISYETSGSAGAKSLPYLVTSSRYDYHEPIQPVVLGNTLSEVANVTTKPYNSDIFYGKAFDNPNAYASGAASNYTTTFTASAAIFENNWTAFYGLQLVSLYINNTQQTDPWTSTAYWSLSGSHGLQFQTPAPAASYTASIKLPAFFYEESDLTTHNYIYSITITADVDNFDPNYLELHYGDLDCGLTGSINPVAINTTTTIQTKAVGGFLGLRWYVTNTGNGPMFMKILKLQVRSLNYRADVQDFHLQYSTGMINARYNGCKLTSTDYNVDSPDTIDKGPVIELVVGGGKQLQTKPTQRGNFNIL